MNTSPVTALGLEQADDDLAADHGANPSAAGTDPELDEESNRDEYNLPDSPLDWTQLNARHARLELRELDRWVHFLRTAYGLPAAVVPPLWHRHDELIWELSALHQHWLKSYHPDAELTEPLNWHREFAAARDRLRDWVSTCGTRGDRDRPTRQTTWPGEPDAPKPADVPITDRNADFCRFLDEDTAQRTSTSPAG